MNGAGVRAKFVFNVLGPLLRAAISLVTVPIYVRHVGAARYGVISITWVMLGYFGFLDLGLSRAATNALAKLHDAPQAERARILLTTLALNLGFGLAGSVILFFVGGYLFVHVILVPESLGPELAQSLPWIASLLPMALVSGVGIGALESRERFLMANALQVGVTSIIQVAPVVAAVVISPSLAVVIPAIALAQVFNVILTLIVVYHYEGPFSFREFDGRKARSLLGYGGWITLTNILSPILTSVDQFLIGSLSGVAAVTYYSVPMSLVTRSLIFPAALGRTFFPRMSGLGSAAATQLAQRAISALAYGHVAVCAPAIICAPLFFKYWIGPEFATVASPVAQILLFGAWFNGLAFVAVTLLQSQGRPDLSAKIHLAEIAPFVAILWALVTKIGIDGAALAWTFRVIADALTMFWAAGALRTTLRSALRPFAILCASAVGAQFLGKNLGEVLLTASAVATFSVILGFFFSEDWRIFIRSFFEWAIRRKRSWLRTSSRA
jgi:O-antigen/teichoic acid export membrane protein